MIPWEHKIFPPVSSLTLAASLFSVLSLHSNSCCQFFDQITSLNTLWSQENHELRRVRTTDKLYAAENALIFWCGWLPILAQSFKQCMNELIYKIASYTQILKNNSMPLWEKSIVLWKLSPTTEIGNFIPNTTTHKHTKAQGYLGGQGGCKIITPFELQLTRTTCTLWQSRSPRDTRFVI